MGLWNALTGSGSSDTRFGQQRRRAADRAGHARMDSKVRQARTVDSHPAPRAWWRSS
ncbi:hypothetical protein ACWEQL_20145 [Kitasatospora sp. NPDC004240]